MTSIRPLPIKLGSQEKHSNGMLSLGSDPLLVFDIDDTLYTPDTMVHPTIRNGLYEYAAEKLGISFEEARDLGVKYNNEYGLGVKGYIYEHSLDPKGIFEHIMNSMKPEELLNQDTELRDILNRIPYNKIIFTNGTLEQATRILNALGIMDCFELLFHVGYSYKDFWSKPEKRCYKYIESIVGIEKPNKIYFFDDALQNINMANELGWHGIHVGPNTSIKTILKNLFEKEI
ncbi:hypothetical protein TCON_0469 [Astathelohania contejeani]|uniref:Pyrimidine 5-nucleotidase n=1 Tax=Astathelohania contejeani TaxID=164912 RepID=A0ABQ7I1J0_9MICR|nr:hypothetical protein TCON_0469 [Thelohania contejeani]